MGEIEGLHAEEGDNGIKFNATSIFSFMSRGLASSIDSGEIIFLTENDRLYAQYDIRQSNKFLVNIIISFVLGIFFYLCPSESGFGNVYFSVVGVFFFFLIFFTAIDLIRFLSFRSWLRRTFMGACHFISDH
jgi:hypothetical protein